MLATDVDFGPDGALYFSDWVEGWEMTKKGRIYRVIDPSRRDNPEVQNVKTLLAAGMTGRSLDELTGLLAHADTRVRQQAQFELAGRGENGWKTLARIATSHGPTLSRIHAIWGLGQAARPVKAGLRARAWQVFEPLLADSDAEVRAQAAKAVGELKEQKAFDPLIVLLRDASPRVRFFAALALGKLGSSKGTGPLVDLVRTDAGHDPFLRHAGVMGLVGSGKSDAWQIAAKDPSPAVRMAVLLAMRRLEDPEMARFLVDSDPQIVLEAARAIHDVPIAAAMPGLAKVRLTSETTMPLARRVLDARFRSGTSEDALALAEAATGADQLPEAARLLALEMLAEWPHPSGRDRVVGLWRPIAARSPQAAIDALKPRLTELLGAKSKAIRLATIAAIGALDIKEAGARLAAIGVDPAQTDATRAEALKVLDRLADPRRIETAQRALLLPGDHSRTEALGVLSRIAPAAAVAPLKDRLAHGSTTERQGALAILAAMPGEAAHAELSKWLDQLVAGHVQPEIQLDLIEAAARRPEADLRQKLDAFQASKARGDIMAPYREVLSGGDAQRGFNLFKSKAELECVRCHKIADSHGEKIGGEVGPELTGIGARQPRAYLLESIVHPDKQIARGFESVVLATGDGKVYSGVFRGEDANTVRLITAEGKLVDIAKSTIEERNAVRPRCPATW